MAVVTRTVGDLLGDLRDRADIEHMARRHPPERLRHHLTQSLRGLQSELIRFGYTEHLTWGDSAALPTTAADGGDESFLEVAFPAGIEVHGMDVNTGTNWYPLRKIQLEDRREYESRQGERPAAYLLQSLPRTPDTGTSVTAGIIQVYPASSRGDTYRLIYLEPMPPLLKNSQVVYGFDGDWLEWVVWDAAIKVLYRDDEADPSQDAKAQRERAKIESRMGVNITRVNRGPVVPRRASGSRLRRRVV